MNNIIENIRQKKCENCNYCYIKYVKNGTKSYCGIDDKEINSNTKPCGMHRFIN